MIKSVILILVVGVILLELIEHVLLPLFWFIKGRKRKSACGISGMFDKVGEVKQWHKNEGKVYVDGELWQAFGEVSFLPGDKVIVKNVEGLKLEVTPWRI